MAVFKCKICGGALEINPGLTVATCEYCGTKQTLPRLDDEKKANLFDRANHFRRNNDFDKAMCIYEQILNDDTEDAESYWSLVLCRYGIEYVEDPATHKRIPTVNRAQFTSVFDDEDYKSAIKCADSEQRKLYEAEAAAINEIQKGILAISQKEEPFDVFICYKETDKDGRRTQDSVLATELYHELTKDGFKVFFSRITLEDKLGTAYEPYIFAALNSSKVMVALGTREEYFNAVWVKNEWSRYLSLIKNGAKKVLIPAYRDMDPYDLPEEFSHLQAQDMAKLGFMQDLVRGIKKIVSADASPAIKETVIVQNAVSGNGAALVKRGILALEDGEWEKADGFFEQALNCNAEDAQAYLGKLLAEMKVRTPEGLRDCSLPFDKSGNYQKAVRFGDETLKNTLNGYIELINKRNEEREGKRLYSSAIDCMNENTKVGYWNAINIFNQIPNWRDSQDKIKRCRELIRELDEKEEQRRAEYKRRVQIETEKRKKRLKFIRIFIAAAALIAVVCTAAPYVTNNIIIPNAKYKKAMEFISRGEKLEAMALLNEIAGYKDSFEQLRSISDMNRISIGYFYAAGVKKDGTVAEAEKIGITSDWKDIVSVSASGTNIVGLKTDGTVVAKKIPCEYVVDEEYHGQYEVSDWKGIVAVSADYNHTVGLKKDGTVVATKYVGDYYSGQCDVSDWKDVVAISAGREHTVGLKKDGTVVATEYLGDDDYGQCDVSDWKDIVAVSAGYDCTIGLKKDGTVVATGYLGNGEFYTGECDVSDWKDIVAVSAGDGYTIGLKKDGTVVATKYIGPGEFYNGECDVSDWKDIVAVSAGGSYTIGLKKDGTAIAIGGYAADADNIQTDVSGWNLLK